MRQRYRDNTNILDTIFTTATGVALITDFMPVEERTLKQHARLHDNPRLVRIVECLSGRVRLRHVVDPAPDYGRRHVTVATRHQHLHADTGDLHICVRCTRPLESARTSITLHAGEHIAFALRCGLPNRCGPIRWDVERALDLLRETQEFWWQWIGRCRYDGPYRQHVWRSALVLKLMTYSPTGAIVAAPTTSLPEWIGGTRNWDYRFTWLRDASLTLFAFFQLGLREEAHSYFHWLSTHHRRTPHMTGLPNLFDLDGHARVPERELRHLTGYKHSQPVRVGNDAAHQLQLDVYGEVLDSAYLYARFGGDISGELWNRLHAIVELAIERWRENDACIWEVRDNELPYTYSKMMCWVAVDRGLRMAQRFGYPHDSARWQKARRAMHRAVVTEGWSKRRNAFAQYFGGNTLDAAMLRLSQVRFLPDRDPRVVSTIKAIDEDLSEGVLVRRYRTEETNDGVGGDEGAFFMTSFWLPDALAHTGDVEGAQRRFERLLSFSSPVGLFSEEVDPRSGALLGNYPQAFTHLSLVGAAVNIERARHRQIGVRGLKK